MSATTRWQILYIAWFIALLSTLSVLFIGEVLGQEPCILCWYQRAFMFPLAVVLGVACYRSDIGVRFYALPLALIGVVIAAYHTLLYSGLVPKPLEPCGIGPSCSDATMSIFGGVPIPALSFLAFGSIGILLLLIRKGTIHEQT